MRTKMPDVIDAYIQAANSRDADRFGSLFPEDAIGHAGAWRVARRRARRYRRTPKTNCDIISVGPAYNRLQNAIRNARMCRVRKGSGYG